MGVNHPPLITIRVGCKKKKHIPSGSSDLVIPTGSYGMLWRPAKFGPTMMFNVGNRIHLKSSSSTTSISSSYVLVQCWHFQF